MELNSNIRFRIRAQAEHPADKTHEIGPEILNAVKPLELAGPKPSEATDEIALTLGDFLPRIAVRFLKHGEHDGTREVRFKISEVGSMITSRKTKVPLSRIAEVCPDIFRDDTEGFQTAEVYFPWQKLAEVVRRIKPAGASDAKAQEPIDVPSEATRLPLKPPITVFANSKAAPATSPPPQMHAKRPLEQPEDVRRQRDLAVQQRDLAQARLKSCLEQMHRQLAIAKAERDNALSEKADALAFISLFTSLREGASAN